VAFPYSPTTDRREVQVDETRGNCSWDVDAAVDVVDISHICSFHFTKGDAHHPCEVIKFSDPDQEGDSCIVTPLPVVTISDVEEASDERDRSKCNVAGESVAEIMLSDDEGQGTNDAPDSKRRLEILIVIVSIQESVLGKGVKHAYEGDLSMDKNKRRRVGPVGHPQQHVIAT
jgi:hypothetical protein